jgi:hypothetical protein
MSFMATPAITITVRMSIELHARVEKVSDELGIAVNAACKLALDEWCARQERQLEKSTES